MMNPNQTRKIAAIIAIILVAAMVVGPLLGYIISR